MCPDPFAYCRKNEMAFPYNCDPQCLIGMGIWECTPKKLDPMPDCAVTNDIVYWCRDDDSQEEMYLCDWYDFDEDGEVQACML